MTAAGASGTVCVVGSINLDLMLSVDQLPVPGETVLGEPIGRLPGGKGFNQAIAAQRCGARTTFSGAVGDDAEGALLRGVAVEAGVDTTYLLTTPGSVTGMAHVFALPGAENSIVVVPGANAAVSAASAEAAVAGAGVVLVQLEIPVEVAGAALATARRTGAFTILNAAPAKPESTELLNHVDLLVVNESEAEALGGPERCLGLGARSVVVTLGARGCELHRVGSSRVVFDAFTVEAVDSTGAGDAFCGGLAAALANGVDLTSAIRRAAAAGAIVASALGAQTDQLTVTAVDQLAG